MKVTLKHRRGPMRLAVAGLAAGAAMCAADANAALLVYEGFHGYGTSLFNTAPNQHTIGLNKTVNYGPASVSTFTVSPTSLPFSSSFPTLPGSLGTTQTIAGIAAAQLQLSQSHVGTLYHSYLVRFGGHGTTSGNGTQTRVADNQATTNDRFYAEADTRSGTLTTQGVTYHNNSYSTAGITLGTDTTYLLIARWTNVGTTLSETTTGQGTVFVLTSDQFDSFVAAGSLESYLDTTATGPEATSILVRHSGPVHTSSTNNAFNSGAYVQFVQVGHTVDVDEIRYGTTLIDVVPEPAGVALTSLVALGLLRRRSRRA